MRYAKYFLKRGFELEVTKKLWNDINMPGILKFFITIMTLYFDFMLLMIGLLVLMWPLIVVMLILRVLGIPLE